MVASTDIKFYVHTNNNAPQLQNAYGSMIQVLDACLVNGIQLGAVSSLTASGTTVTATFSTAHNLMQYQVIQIAGAIQAEYNGQHRILSVPSSTTVTFALAAAPTASPATGAISASLPPLGWEKPFSSTNANGGGKAAYRSTNLLLPSRPFLRVVDELDPAYTATYAKYAKVGIVEDMTSMDTMLGVQAPYDSSLPNKNWVGTGSGTTAYNGWAKWYYARSSNFTSGFSDAAGSTDGNRNWVLIGDSDSFYIIPSVYITEPSALIYGFGSFDSAINADVSSNFLSATLAYGTAASMTTSPATNTPCGSSSVGNLLLQRQYSQNSQYITAFAQSAMLATLSPIHSGYSNYISSEATIGVVQFVSVNIVEHTTINGSTPQLIRGVLPKLHWLFQSVPFANLSTFQKDGGLYLAKSSGVYAGYTGQVVFKIGDLL